MKCKTCGAMNCVKHGGAKMDVVAKAAGKFMKMKKGKK